MSRRLFLSAAVAAALVSFTFAHEAPPKPLVFTLFRDANADNNIRWHLKSPNGRILADSGEGYWRLADARHAIDVIRTGASSARVVGLGEAEAK